MNEEGRVTGFLERPKVVERSQFDSNWVNSGVCLCSPDILDVIPAGLPSDLPRDVFPGLIGTGRAYGFPLSGYRCAVDSPERYDEAEASLKEGRCRIPSRDKTPGCV